MLKLGGPIPPDSMAELHQKARKTGTATGGVLSNKVSGLRQELMRSLMHDTYEKGTLQNKMIPVIEGIKTGLGTETKARSCFDLFLTDITRLECSPERRRPG